MSLVIASANQIYVFDTAKNDWHTPLWSWTKSNWGGPTDVRMRQDVHGKQFVVAGGSSTVLVVDYPDGQLILDAAAQSSIHSAELLPDGVVVGAAPHGTVDDGRGTAGALTMHRQHLVHAGTQLADWHDRLLDAHGVLWDETTQTLWAVGRQGTGPQTAGGSGLLRKYAWHGYAADPPLTISDEFTVPTDPRPLDQISDHFRAFPGWYESPHDIAPIPGSRDFLVTTDVKVVAFNVANGTFYEAPAEIAALFEVKGLGIHPQSQQITLLRHDQPNGDYSSDHIEFYRPTGSRTVGWKEFYKARWVDNDPTWTATFIGGTSGSLSQVDAAVLGRNRTPWFFGGDRYLELDWTHGTRNGYATPIKDAWPGLPTEMHSDLDAVILGTNNGNPRFFKGDWYAECDLKTGKLVGRVRKISEVWPGLKGLGYRVDTALMGPDGDPRFFREDKYVQCRWGDGALVDDVRTIAHVWPGMPSEMHSDLNAAFMGRDGDPRFIKKSAYAQCTWGSGKWVEGPLDLFAVWPGLRT
ncbi:hypothetical protein AB0H00_27825 [Nocardia sp. NPDC023852]|uniref:hypothetical protein n=1 Tax=Nocardia sp. NPDC023852 TaxID=3154697 RepID=UPI003404C5DE